DRRRLCTRQIAVRYGLRMLVSAARHAKCSAVAPLGKPNNPLREPVMNKSKISVAQKDVLSLLLDDHKEAKKLFKEFENTEDDARKEALAREVCMELTAHTTIEEEVFYPFLREHDAEEFGDLLNEALVEHASAKELIAQIRGMGMQDDLFEAKVTVLGEYVSHHVKEEEEELFPKVISKKIELRELLTPMTERKEEALQSAVA